jgi:hypothetical protein
MGMLDQFLSAKKWFLHNEDTNEIIVGQFAPEGLTQEVSSNWAQHTSLNRNTPILQYINGKSDTISFNSMFYSDNFVNFYKVEEKIKKLKSWAKRNSDISRPPIVTFWLGDGHLEQTSIIDSISGITYGEPTILGTIRFVKFTVNLLQYEEFDIEATETGETRYHRSRERDYYELVAYREYKDPNIGDVIRKRHPTKPNIVAGTIVKLPSSSAIKTEKVTQTSTSLKTAYGRSETPQKALRVDMFNRRNRSYVSHVIVE